jgi:hypothetical protein
LKKIKPIMVMRRDVPAARDVLMIRPCEFMLVVSSNIIANAARTAEVELILPGSSIGSLGDGKPDRSEVSMLGQPVSGVDAVGSIELCEGWTKMLAHKLKTYREKQATYNIELPTK